MRKFTMIGAFILVSGLITGTVSAQADKFSKGPLIKDYGPIATVNGMEALPKGAEFKVSFDLAKQSKAGTVNRNIESAARFLNMHVAAGMKPEDLNLALVVHGSAVFDFTKDAKYQTKEGQDNINKQLIADLIANGVEIHICGQSATFQGVSADDLLPNVKMSLSAMTAHALLQQKGYTLNPF